MNLELETFFSPDYATARDRFRNAAWAAGAALEALALEARGPHGEDLTIDVAWLGSREAKRVLLHSSGVHGVEAFAGSAVQLAALEQPPALPADCALVLAHVINPYGMAWLRRVNEHNVDLNRNCLGPGERREGAPALYSRLDPLLNPPSPPRADGFRLRLALLVLRYGWRAVQQAIAEGQYEYAQGLFFGGKTLEPGPLLYLEWLQRNVARDAYLFAIDFHTGLGRRGGQTLILEPGVSATPQTRLSVALGKPLRDPAAGAAAYRIRGGMGGVLPSTLPGARIDFVLQEIGTSPPLVVLGALRKENRYHYFHAPQDLHHPAKRALLEALCPVAADWRSHAVQHGLELLRSAARWTFRQE